MMLVRSYRITRKGDLIGFEKSLCSSLVLNFEKTANRKW